MKREGKSNAGVPVDANGTESPWMRRGAAREKSCMV